MDERHTVDSKFRFVLVAAHRAEQLLRGARPKIEPGKRKSTRVAMDEVNRGLVDWGYGPAPQEEAPAEQTEEQAAGTPDVH